MRSQGVYCKNVRQYDFPEKNLVVDSYVHNLTKLVRVANLEAELKRRLVPMTKFAANWDVVRNWPEQSRYEHGFWQRMQMHLLMQSPTSSMG